MVAIWPENKHCEALVSCSDMVSGNMQNVIGHQLSFASWYQLLQASCQNFNLISEGWTYIRTWRAASLQLKTYLNLNIILQKVYLFCGILTFIPVVLSCLFSMRLCRKLEQKSKATSRILTYILVSVGFYPQYLATRFLNLLSLRIKVITLIFQNNFDRVRLSWG